MANLDNQINDPMQALQRAKSIGADVPSTSQITLSRMPTPSPSMIDWLGTFGIDTPGKTGGMAGALDNHFSSVLPSAVGRYALSKLQHYLHPESPNDQSLTELLLNRILGRK